MPYSNHILRICAAGLALAPLASRAAESAEVKIPKWPVKWHSPPAVPGRLFDLEKLKPAGTRFAAEVPATLDLAERARLSVNMLVGNVKPVHTQAFNFGVNPPKAEGGGAVLPKHLRTLPLLRAMCGSEQGMDVEAELMRNRLEGLCNEAAAPDLYYFGPGYGPLVMALANWNLRSPDPQLRKWIEWNARMLCDNALLVADRAYYPPSSLRDKTGKWFNGDTRFESPMPYHPPEEPSADQQGTEGTVKWEQAMVLRALLRDFGLNGNRDSLEMAGRFARFILKPDMWQDGGPHNGAFAGHWHGNLWTLQALLEWALLTKNQDTQRIVVRAYEHARKAGAPAMGWFPGWLDPEKFKRSPVLAQLNETCGVADTLILAVKLTEAGLGDYWDDVDGIVRNHLTQMQFIDFAAMQRCAGNNPANDEALRRYLGAFGMAEPSANPPMALGCCSANGALSLYYAWRGIVSAKDGAATVNLLLNRASQWLDVESSIPYEGKVVLRIRSAKHVRVRLPTWVAPGTLAATLNDKAVAPKEIGRFVQFHGLKTGDVITLRFDLRERSETYAIAGGSYTLKFRGGTALDISPRSTNPALLPLFQYPDFKPGPAPMMKVERFINAGPAGE